VDLAVLFEVITSGDWTSMAIMIVVVFLAQGRKVIDSFDYIRDRKIRSLSALKDLEKISDETKFVIEESLDQIAFLRATGISTSRKGRKRITDLIKDSGGKVSPLGLKMISSYIRNENGEVKVVLTRLDWFEMIWNLITLLLILILIFSLIVSTAQLEKINHLVILHATAVGLFGLIVALAALRTIITFKRAREAKDLFTKSEQRESSLSGKEANT